MFTNHAHRALADCARPAASRQHLFVGSGVVESSCKTVIGQRLKQSGMQWTLSGTDVIIALHC
jgi:hypothetical protein